MSCEKNSIQKKTDNLHKAIEFAAIAHADQKRKGTETPYIVHPFEVAQVLTSAKCDVDVIIAGLLHDTIEDTDVDIDEIGSLFGDKVAKLVASCSEDKSRSWEERKEHTIKFLAQETDIDVLMLSCADKLANLRSIYSDLNSIGESLWNRFNKGKEKQQWYYKGLINSLVRLEDMPMYKELKETFSDCFYR